MTIISRYSNLFALVDIITITAMAFLTSLLLFASVPTLCVTILWLLIMTFGFLYKKGVYKSKKFSLGYIYLIFESILIATVLASIPLIFIKQNAIVIVPMTLYALATFFIMLMIRGIKVFVVNVLKKEKNVLIVGAGQNGKLIASEIQARPELGLKVVGFLDDNMNTIEDEDSSIPVLGLTCDSEAVIKDNNVKIVIIAVKSRMDSNILTDLVKGIPLGVRVWRMPKFYEKITKKYLASKMAVNWLFYDCVKKKALIYTNMKRICDVLGALFLLLITLPLSIIAMIGIKFSDFGPIFFSQTRSGKFEKPFKMLKFRTMYQNEVADDFDDEVSDVNINDKRVMPFGRILRKFHIDELPQMINVLRGEMSIVGPRPVREEIYFENKNKIPFWESRNWVHPGWCGWQQINVNDPSAEERLGYDLYYIKHRNAVWEISIVIQYIIKVLTGKLS